MINRLIFSILLSAIWPAILVLGQVPGNASLSGKYWFRYVQISADASSSVTQAVSSAGSLTFDGAGKFTYAGNQTTGAAATGAISGNGTYTVSSNGFVTLSAPQTATLTMNGRAGLSLLVASSTEGQSNTFDLLIAMPAAASGGSAATVNGTYQAATLEFPSGSTAQARSTAFSWTANGAGSLGSPVVNGHANNLGGTSTTQTITGATYTVTADGSGTATFPLTGANTAATQLLSGSKTIYVSADGNYILGGSTAAGNHDILFAVKALTGDTIGISSLSGLFFTNGLSWTAAGGGFYAYAGSANSAGQGSILFHRRYHAPAGTLDFTGANSYTLNVDGTGTTALDRLAVGAAGRAWFSAGIGATATGTYNLNLAVLAPGMSGTGVFVSPAGVVNAASLAPVGSPVSPGEYVSLFGVGLAAQPAGATAFPIPTSLGNVQVRVNGTPAPLNYVSANQINLLVPFGVTGSTAAIQVTNGATSNTVTVPLAPTAPGIFSQSSAGSGAGVILHADFSLVTGANPARRGETVLIFMTGLGSVNPPLGDGARAPSSPLSLVTANLSVFVDSELSAIQYKGLAPGFAGLYQLNVVLPGLATLGPAVPVAISTNEAFLDQITIAIK